MLKVATYYYKDIFKFDDRPDIKLKDDFFSKKEKVIAEENIMLGSVFTEEELKEVVFGSFADGGPRPDGLSFMFYQTF
jgi:hypothetical protein